MSIALLIESQAELGKNQTLLVPTTKEVLVFHRLSNGQRGRGQRWLLVNDLDTLPTVSLSRQPVGVIMTERDVIRASAGDVTALSTKALAVETGEATLTTDHADTVRDFVDRLFSGDNTLNDYVADARRSNPIVLSPIVEPVLETAYFPATAPVEPMPSNVVTLPTAQRQQTELASVPDRKWADEYLNRKNVSNSGKTDHEMLDLIMANNENLIIRGGAGSGKTMCILSWASARGYRYYNVSANVGLEPSHLFGAWTPTEQAGVFRWQDGPVTDLVRHGGVLLLNEIDFIPERVTTVLFGLLDARREIQLLENGGEVIKAHKDLIVIGDHNPNYRGARPMNQAWKDRFHHKWEFDYDKAIERKLIKNAELLDVAGKLRDQALKGEIDTPISTRALMAFVNNAERVNVDYAIEVYLNGFADDERDGVKLVLETAKAGIEQGFGIKTNYAQEVDEN